MAGDSTITKFFAINLYFLVAKVYQFFLNITGAANISAKQWCPGYHFSGFSKAKKPTFKAGRTINIKI
ncbi:hypothetical protein DHB64_00700 [Antarcticibacterium sp. W02-3]|nr:hypothetical protein [Antarcticibacterium sp. W02-3]